MPARKVVHSPVRTLHGLKEYQNSESGFYHDRVKELAVAPDQPAFLCCVAGDKRGSWLMVFGFATAPASQDSVPVRRLTPEEKKDLHGALKAKHDNLLISFW